MGFRPKNGEKFNAYDTTTGKKAVGDPFKARRVTGSRVEAADRHGWLRVFNYDMWRFKKLA